MKFVNCVLIIVLILVFVYYFKQHIEGFKKQASGSYDCYSPHVPESDAPGWEDKGEVTKEGKYNIVLKNMWPVRKSNVVYSTNDGKDQRLLECSCARKRKCLNAEEKTAELQWVRMGGIARSHKYNYPLTSKDEIPWEYFYNEGKADGMNPQCACPDIKNSNKKYWQVDGTYGQLK
jgi:hypothetical protein